MKSEALLLPSPEHETKSGVVNSANLADYLMQKKQFNECDLSFAPVLDLSWCTPIMETIYKNIKLKYVLDDEERKKAMDGFQILQDTGLIDEESKNILTNRTNTQKEVERIKSIYYDQIDNSIGSTETEYGGLADVASSEEHLQGSGKVVIMTAHTHPLDRMFSRVDFKPIITPKEDESRDLNGILVLCPNIQILALASPQTPLLKREESNRIIEEWEEKIEDDKLILLRKQVSKIALKKDLFLMKVDTEVAKTGESIQKKYDHGDITGDEGDRLAMEKQQELMRDYTTFIETWQPEVNAALNEMYDHYLHNLNNMLVEFSRFFNIKLFTSTNRKDFHIFSA